MKLNSSTDHTDCFDRFCTLWKTHSTGRRSVRLCIPTKTVGMMICGAALHLKIAALRCHESQVRELGKPDLEGWLRQWCTTMAEGEAFELAEAFHRIVLDR